MTRLQTVPVKMTVYLTLFVPFPVSMGNLAQLAKQLTRLTSQPAEGAGSGTQTPAEGVSARRLTASGTGTTQVSLGSNPGEDGGFGLAGH